MEPFIGQIQAFGFNFAPRGWAKCEGQLLPIAQNTALFSLLGTTYGGDGRSTFGLPDLRSRSIVGMGQGSGFSEIRLGERGGTEQIQLNELNLPSHNHALVNGTANGSIETLGGGSFVNETGNFQSKIASGGSQLEIFMESDGTVSGALDVNISGTTSAAGSNQPFLSRNPFLGINMCIALVGIFPPRS